MTTKTIFPTIIGVDPSSYELACIWGKPDEPVKFRRIILGKQQKIQIRAGKAFNEFGALLGEITEEDGGEPPRVFMEAPIHVPGRPQSTIPQVYVQGAVMAACFEFMVPITQVHNQTWKMKVCGNGQIDKAEVKVRMKEIWPDFVNTEGVTEDLIDGGAIYMYGVQRVKIIRSLQRARGK